MQNAQEYSYQIAPPYSTGTLYKIDMATKIDDGVPRRVIHFLVPYDR